MGLRRGTHFVLLAVFCSGACIPARGLNDYDPIHCGDSCKEGQTCLHGRCEYLGDGPPPGDGLTPHDMMPKDGGPRDQSLPDLADSSVKDQEIGVDLPPDPDATIYDGPDGSVPDITFDQPVPVDAPDIDAPTVDATVDSIPSIDAPPPLASCGYDEQFFSGLGTSSQAFDLVLDNKDEVHVVYTDTVNALYHSTRTLVASSQEAVNGRAGDMVAAAHSSMSSVLHLLYRAGASNQLKATFKQTLGGASWSSTAITLAGSGGFDLTEVDSFDVLGQAERAVVVSSGMQMDTSSGLIRKHRTDHLLRFNPTYEAAAWRSQQGEFDNMRIADNDTHYLLTRFRGTTSNNWELNLNAYEIGAETYTSHTPTPSISISSPMAGAVDNTGSVYLAFAPDQGAGLGPLYYANWNGADFADLSLLGNAAVVAGNTVNADSLSMVLDSQNRAHTFYQVVQGATKSLQWGYANGLNWQTEKITDDAGEFTRAALSSTGNLYVAYSKVVGANNVLMLSCRKLP